MATVMRPLRAIAELRKGDIIRHVNGANAYVVTATHADHAIAVRTQHISNPSEWLVLREQDP